MTYDYALDFTPDGVRLLKGSGKDQILVGQVALDDPHFETRLEDLRKEVEADTGEPLSTALLIPHSEILFHTMNLEEEDDAERELRVRTELDGLTPYGIDDLVYDWKAISKTQLQIAAVARETLAEADGFAARNGFGPGVYTTHPKPGAFRGQPDFGASDRPPPPPFPKPEPEPEPTPPESESAAPPVEAPAQALPDASSPPAGSPEPAEVQAESPPASADPSQPAAPVPPADAPQEDAPAPEAGAKDDPTPLPPVMIDDFAEFSPIRQPLSPLAPVDPTARAARRGYVPPGRMTSAPDAASGAPARDDGVPGDAGPDEDATARAALAPGAADATTVAGGASFSTRRQADPQAAGSQAAQVSGRDDSRLGSIASRIAMLPDGGAGPRPLPTATNGRDAAAAAGTAAAGAAATGAAATGAAAAGTAAVGAAAAAVGPRIPPHPTGRPGPVAPIPTVRKVEAPDSITGAAQSLGGTTRPRAGLSEAEALTVFGMREPETGRWRALLSIAIGLVVALLLALAIWAAFFFLSASDDPVETSALVDDQDTTLAQPVAPEVTPDEIRPPGPDSDSVDTVLLAPDTAPDAAPDPQPAAPDVVPEEPPLPEDVVILSPDADATADVDANADTDADVAAQVEAEEPAAEIEAPADPAPEPVDPALMPGPNDPLRRSPDAPETTRYAATGISTDAPNGSDTPVAETLETIPGALEDGTIRTMTEVSAPRAPSITDFAVPGPLIPPAPAGTRFDFDTEGRVIATPEGTVSPQGVRITAGRPPVSPPAAPDRPEGSAPDAEAAGAAAATVDPAAEVVPDESDLTVPVTGGPPETVPPARPEEPAAETDDQAALPATGDTPRIPVIEVTRGTDPVPLARPAGLIQASLPAEPETFAADPALAGFTPRARPAALIEATAEPEVPQITQAESETQAQAVAAAIAAIIPETEPVSPYAVERSRRPDPRPQDLSTRAEPVRVASAAATVTPRTPTAGSVASRATEANAIRLNKMNLIGVYGTQSNRRALVRLPSGRFVKVKVGDSVDGGRVRVIGTDQLQYVKGGRALTLTMPQG